MWYLSHWFDQFSLVLFWKCVYMLELRLVTDYFYYSNSYKLFSKEYALGYCECQIYVKRQATVLLLNYENKSMHKLGWHDMWENKERRNLFFDLQLLRIKIKQIYLSIFFFYSLCYISQTNDHNRVDRALVIFTNGALSTLTIGMAKMAAAKLNREYAKLKGIRRCKSDLAVCHI